MFLIHKRIVILMTSRNKHLHVVASRIKLTGCGLHLVVTISNYVKRILDDDFGGCDWCSRFW